MKKIQFLLHWLLKKLLYFLFEKVLIRLRNSRWERWSWDIEIENEVEIKIEDNFEILHFWLLIFMPFFKVVDHLIRYIFVQRRWIYMIVILSKNFRTGKMINRHLLFFLLILKTNRLSKKDFVKRWHWIQEKVQYILQNRIKGDIDELKLCILRSFSSSSILFLTFRSILFSSGL